MRWRRRERMGELCKLLNYRRFRREDCFQMLRRREREQERKRERGEDLLYFDTDILHIIFRGGPGKEKISPITEEVRKRGNREAGKYMV